MHHADVILMKVSRETLSRLLERCLIYFECDKDSGVTQKS